MLKDMLDGYISQKEVLAYYNANISYENLPKGINGYVWQYRGFYNIFINKKLSYLKRKKTLLHELAHIELNQLCQIDKDLFAFHVQEYEDEADKYINFLTE